MLQIRLTKNNMKNIIIIQQYTRLSKSQFKLKTLRTLKQKYPSIPWTDFLNKMLLPYTTINEDEKVIVYKPSFFTALERLLARTSKRVQANYVIWRALADSVTYLSNEIRNQQTLFNAIVTGKSSIS